jgi:hypothetical protein
MQLVRQLSPFPLQEYNTRKQLEHTVKSFTQDGSKISVVDPVAYARRFQAFMLRVFRPQ